NLKSHLLTPQMILQLQRTIGNRATLSFINRTADVQHSNHEEVLQSPSREISAAPSNNIHLGRYKIKKKKPVPRYLRYHGNPRRQLIGRSTRLHTRHIIPHSDLQSWVKFAAKNPDAAGNNGISDEIIEVREQLEALLIALGHNTEAAFLDDFHLQ